MREKMDASAAALYPVEHHRFLLDGRWHLFDVNALTVISSLSEDADILAAASNGIVARATSDRVAFLADHGFLTTDGAPAAQADPTPPGPVVTAMVSMSQRCNLRCTYCYVHEGKFDFTQRPIPYMDETTASALPQRLAALLPGFTHRCYHFYGGEPLMNFPAILAMVAAAEALAAEEGSRAEYHITTNGTLLTPEIAAFMGRHRFTVYLSVDGDETTHDTHRVYADGSGSYHDVVAGLDLLRGQSGIHLIGSAVIRDGLSLGDALARMKAHGVCQCKAERTHLEATAPLSLTGTAHERYLADTHALAGHYIASLEAGHKPMDIRLNAKILQLFLRRRRDFFCPAGERMIGVDASGDLYPCALHIGRDSMRLGDLTGIDDVAVKRFRHDFAAKNQPRCQGCWSRHLCGGGCSAMVDRFGEEDCAVLRAESEAAIAVHLHFAETDPLKLVGIVSPRIVQWANGQIDDPATLAPAEGS